MKRREFLVAIGGVATWPLVARARQRERVRHVGLLTNAELETGTQGRFFKLFLDELQKLGWVEGRNVRLDARFGAGDDTQTGVVAADLVHLAPDVIVTAYLAALRAVQQQTKTIPIVFVGGGDAVQNGIVRNQAHPEGSITGFANLFDSLGGKWLELLKEIAPNVVRVLYLYIPGSGGFLASIETAAQSLGVQVVATPVSDADGMKVAIETFAADRNGGLLPSPGVFLIPPVELIRMTARYCLPAIYGIPYFPANGGLMSYTADPSEIVHGAADYVDRLLRGAKVSDLPVQYPTKFHLSVNLRTAKALGLEVPLSILLRADEVIE
jgi:putative tryptophan/tyrosine transport system substrate-binding protein